MKNDVNRRVMELEHSEIALKKKLKEDFETRYSKSGFFQTDKELEKKFSPTTKLEAL